MLNTIANTVVIIASVIALVCRWADTWLPLLTAPGLVNEHITITIHSSYRLALCEPTKFNRSAYIGMLRTWDTGSPTVLSYVLLFGAAWGMHALSRPKFFNMDVQQTIILSFYQIERNSETWWKLNFHLIHWKPELMRWKFCEHGILLCQTFSEIVFFRWKLQTIYIQAADILRLTIFKTKLRPRFELILSKRYKDHLTTGRCYTGNAELSPTRSRWTSTKPQTSPTVLTYSTLVPPTSHTYHCQFRVKHFVCRSHFRELSFVREKTVSVNGLES